MKKVRSAKMENTIENFVLDHNLSIDVDFAGTNEDWFGDRKIDNARYAVTIKSPLGEFTTDYTVGIGVIDRWSYDRTIQKPRGFQHECNVLFSAGLDKASVAYKEAMNNAKRYYKPTLTDVLECLHTDVGCVIDRPSYDEYCEYWGCDGSVQEYKTWKGCKEICKNMTKVLGYKALCDFVEIEPTW